jgi:Glycolipid transfer protein (GLTP)
MPARPSLQYMILWEMDRKVEAQNGSKGGYTSGARSVLRMMWFMDFLGILIRHLLEDVKTLKESAQDAYSKGLGPHHPWVVRTAISAAMAFCPSKDVFWTNLLKESTVTDPSRIKVILGEFLAQMEPVREYLWNYYRTRKIDELP